MKTYTATPAEIRHDWHIVDAEGIPLGRLASAVAQLIRGKHKPTFTPHVDTGDNVIVINAEKVVFTGRKYEDKTYHHHTGYPGGLKTRTPRMIIEGKHPERVVELAVQRMLRRGPLQRKLMTNLRIYKGSEHPHAAQNPEPLDVAKMNRKNARA